MCQWGEDLAAEWTGTLDAEARGVGPGQIGGAVRGQNRDVRQHRHSDEGEESECEGRRTPQPHCPVCVCEMFLISYGTRRKSGVWGWITGIIRQGPSCEPWRRSPRGAEEDWEGWKAAVDCPSNDDGTVDDREGRWTFRGGCGVA